MKQVYFFNEGDGKNKKKLPHALFSEVKKNIVKIEKLTGKKWNSNENPLLVSVRSGAAISMPGMMDTVLNLGLNDQTVEGLARKSRNPRFAYDSYRRFIQMFADVVLGIPRAILEQELTRAKHRAGVRDDTALDAGA